MEPGYPTNVQTKQQKKNKKCITKTYFAINK